MLARLHRFSTGNGGGRGWLSRTVRLLLVKRLLLGALAVGLVIGATLTVLAEGDTQPASIDVSASPGPGGVLEPELGTAIQALRGRVTGQSGEVLVVQTATREILVDPPSGFSAPVGACIQVQGEVPRGQVFQANTASLAPPEACPF